MNFIWPKNEEEKNSTMYSGYYLQQCRSLAKHKHVTLIYIHILAPVKTELANVLEWWGDKCAPPFDFMELKHSFENFFLQTNSYAKRIFWFQNSFGCKICLNPNFLRPKFVWFKFLVKQIFWTWTFFDPSLFCNHVQKLFCSEMVLVLNFFGIRILFGEILTQNSTQVKSDI